MGSNHVTVRAAAGALSLLALVGFPARGDDPPPPAGAQAPDYSPAGIGRSLGITFVTVPSEHFVVHASGGQAIASSVSARLEHAYIAFCETLGLPPGTAFLDRPQEALLLADKAQYDRLVDLILSDPNGAPGAEWEQVVRMASGFHLRQYRVAHPGSGSPEGFHELCAHMMAHTLMVEFLRSSGCPLTQESRFPFWLSEGLAACVDRRVSGTAGSYCIAYGSRESTANPWRDETQRWEELLVEALTSPRESDLPGLRKVHESPETSFDHQMRAVAWSMVSFLVAEDDARERGKFRALVVAMASGQAFETALNDLYGFRDLEAMERKWRRWARR